MSRSNSIIAISDLHLGLPGSYLHSAREEYADNKKALLALLSECGPQDEIVINGDFLELALAGHDDVYTDVKEFFTILAQAGPFQRIVYIPGNHDHHFWRSLVEIMNINGSILQAQDPPSHEFYPYYFVDARFSSCDPALPYDIPLANLWPREVPCPEFVVKYPHHLVRIPLSSTEEEAYFFTHGHYLEPLFKPFNFLIEPAMLEELEAFNNLWLEAFNYNIGHAGKLSKHVFRLLHSYEKGGKKETKKLQDFIYSGHRLISNLLKLTWPKALIIKFFLKYAAKKLSFEGKGKLFKSAIDDNLKYDIRDYITQYILSRYSNSDPHEHTPAAGSPLPTPFTFIFGHTHRPIRNRDREYARVRIDAETYPILNTGGWLRFSGTKELNGESSGLLVINEKGAVWKSLEGQLK